MLPKNTQNNVILRPKNRNESRVQEEINWYLNNGYSNDEISKIIITENEANNILNKLGISPTSTFFEYYLNYCEEPEAYRVEDIYGLSQIRDDYNQPFWADKYPNIQERYLQLSSIEGEYSYFYDKQTDALYGVDWGEMDDFIAGKLKPLFTSFYDFLEWYYSEEDEE
jgi:hypothetical protein